MTLGLCVLTAGLGAGAMWVTGLADPSSIWCGGQAPADAVLPPGERSDAGSNSRLGSALGFFTNGGQYMPRMDCLATAEGEPDWPWIIALIVLNLGVIAAYLRIYWFWIKTYLKEEQRDRNRKLFDLSQIFLWCAVCGYVASVVVFFWPGYRLVALCLILLNVWSWKFALRLDDFGTTFSANRYRRLSETDGLTGLLNRPAMLEAIDRAIDVQRQKPDYGFAVLYLDFDHFKQVNDTFGHDTGDALLRGITDRLQRAMRGGDPTDGDGQRGGSAIARIGGDEFVVLLGSVTPQQALGVARRLCERSAEPFMIDGRPIQTGASIGVATADPDDSAEDVLRNADIAMYSAKTNGRDGCVLFDEKMHADIARSQSIQSSLLHAVADGQVCMVYQPIVDLDEGRVVGFEALMRWHSPELGRVGPDEFIPVAEKSSKLINALGLFALESACRDLSAWRRDRPDYGPLFVNVNVSRRQLVDDHLFEVLPGLLERHGLSPKSIHIEITESAAAIAEDKLVEQLQRLDDLGIPIDLDDFGTGLSAMHCLCSLPLSVVKIDGCFIAQEENRVETLAIVQSIITLAQNLGMDVIAERIETAETVAEMQALGCRMGQGYFFSPPVDTAEVPDLLDTLAMPMRKSA